MLHFKRSPHRWWQKPLAEVEGRPLPAELAVLQSELRPGEDGVWLNSRGTSSGVVDLISGTNGKLVAVRVQLPGFVADALRSLYTAFGEKRGVPDLVIWNTERHRVRLIEVKCPDWDRPSEHQVRFHSIAREQGIEVSIAEWRFEKM